MWTLLALSGLRGGHFWEHWEEWQRQFWSQPYSLNDNLSCKACQPVPASWLVWPLPPDSLSNLSTSSLSTSWLLLLLENQFSAHCTQSLLSCFHPYLNLYPTVHPLMWLLKLSSVCHPGPKFHHASLVAHLTWLIWREAACLGCSAFCPLCSHPQSMHISWLDPRIRHGCSPLGTHRLEKDKQCVLVITIKWRVTGSIRRLW